jgi:hypothetical protein
MLVLYSHRGTPIMGNIEFKTPRKRFWISPRVPILTATSSIEFISKKMPFLSSRVARPSWLPGRLPRAEGAHFNHGILR